MKPLLCSFICLLFLFSAQGQSTVAKKVAVTFAPIPDSVTGSPAAMAAYLVAHSTDQLSALRSLYGWMSSHITYDMVNTFRPDYYKDTADAIVKTLQTRTAVCQGYASLFMDVCRRAHMPAWLVAGYTLTNGKIDNASHAWVAVFVNNQWQFMDPTWGAGSVTSHKYTAKLNWQYFGVAPAVFIKTHVPFDPLFQLLEQPLRHDEVRDGKWAAAAGRPLFAFKDTLAAYNVLPLYKRAENVVARIDRYGVTNQLISGEMTYLINVATVGKQNEEVLEQNRTADRINEASTKYNQAINTFNEYVVFKNNQFSPSRPDREIREWVDAMADQVAVIEKKIAGIRVSDPHNKSVLAEIEESTAQLKRRVAEEQAFVTKYIKTGKLFRKSLFYKLAF